MHSITLKKIKYIWKNQIQNNIQYIRMKIQGLYFFI